MRRGLGQLVHLPLVQAEVQSSNGIHNLEVRQNEEAPHTVNVE